MLNCTCTRLHDTLQIHCNPDRITTTLVSCKSIYATMYCKYYKLQVLYTLFSPILGRVSVYLTVTVTINCAY